MRRTSNSAAGAGGRGQAWLQPGRTYTVVISLAFRLACRDQTSPGTNDPVDHGEVMGDQRVFTDELREIDDNDQQCCATFRLPDGLLTGRTIFDLNNVPGGQLKAAITGGTDGYSKARGEVNNIFKPGNVTIFEIDLT